ncbi:MAG: DUF4847 domain-containing protein [Prevotellaceae bacterium]|jgi:hypothetical protein|nr:DUF4847 domain-containing protein [Prevotellaceae bacterium]
MRYPISILGGLLAALLLLLGCNNEDDVVGIFTEKTWKLTFIALEGHTDRFDFWEGNAQAEKNSMKLLEATGNFNLSFQGATSGKSISGAYNGKGVLGNLTGTWSADGHAHSFSMAVRASTPENDIFAKAFVGGLATAFRYEGDYNNLYIYYRNGQQVMFMGFKPLPHTP